MSNLKPFLTPQDGKVYYRLNGVWIPADDRSIVITYEEKVYVYGQGTHTKRRTDVVRIKFVSEKVCVMTTGNSNPMTYTKRE
jgi:hypothetical protein